MTTATLRPMSTGELLDRTFTLYRSNFLLFVGISVPAPAFMLALVVFSNILDKLPGSKSPVGAVAEVIGAIIAGIIIAGCITALFLGFSLAQAATIRAVAALHLSQPISIRQAYTELHGRYWRIVGVFLSVAIRAVGGSLLMYFASALVGVAAAAAVSILGIAGAVLGAALVIGSVVGGILLALTLFVRYAYAVQACVVEDISGTLALKRSVFLAKGSRNRILTIYVLFAVISGALWGCLALLASLIDSFIHSEQVLSALLWLAFFCMVVLATPLATVAMSLSYYDERVRKEGFDLQVLIAGIEVPKASAVAGS